MSVPAISNNRKPGPFVAARQRLELRPEVTFTRSPAAALNRWSSRDGLRSEPGEVASAQNRLSPRNDRGDPRRTARRELLRSATAEPRDDEVIGRDDDWVD
jgi:hypothetical protein